jgi:hypothetical protein
MNALNRNSILTGALLIMGLIFVAVFGMGCSTDSSSLGPISNDSENIDIANINYPDASTLPAGFVALTRSTSVIGGHADGTLDDHDNTVSKNMKRDKGGDLYLDNNGVSIPRNSIPVERLTITVTLPDEEAAIVDFGPHGTHFDCPVTVRISLEDFEIPEGVELTDLTIFYVNDNSEWEQYNGIVGHNGDWLEAQTDHFSRYIIARSVNS